MSRFAPLFACFLFAMPAGCGGTGSGSDAGDDGRSSVDTHTDSPACHTDPDCDDGLFCDGVERCVSGACVAGAAPSCSDAIACTRDFCSEDRHACVNQVLDVDHDGHGAMSCHDAHGTPLGDDCDDTDPNDFPGNAEVCDPMHHDEDCNPHTHGHVDSDSDGFEDVACCNGTDCGNDCDDSNRSVNPMATEVCNLIDDDCDGRIDEGTGVMLFVDHDRDGWGASMDAMPHCSDAVGFSARGGDCNDALVAVHPGQPEICDMLDNDCDMIVDENAAPVTWYEDHDGDGYGSASAPTTSSCAPVAGRSLLGTDCDDTTASRSPAAPEVCNAIDDDCNGRADFAIGPGDLEDDDADHSPDVHCGPPRGADCNDRDPFALPGAPEICNGRDDDCDGLIDEGATQAMFHRDADGDGYGDPGTVSIACLAPMGFVLDATDCDDTSSMRHPGATETCNASDDDCDGTIDESPAEQSCTIAHAVAACTVGVCHVGNCAPGFSDCTIAPGCETPTLADNTRCGSCTTLCDPMMTECAQSRCEPSGFNGIAGVSPGDDVGTAIALSADINVVGGQTNGRGFGLGCNLSLDARGVAGVLSVRDSGFRCAHAMLIDGSGDEIVTGVVIQPGVMPPSLPSTFFAVLTTTSSMLSVGSIAVNAGAGQGGRDIVVAGFDASANVVWARRFGGPSDDDATAIAVDGAHVWVTTGLRGPLTFGTSTIAASASTDPILVSFDQTTGAPQTALTLVTSSGNDRANALVLDGTSVYVASTVVGSFTLSGMAMTANGPSDALVTVVSPAGPVVARSRVVGGPGADSANGITWASSGFPTAVSELAIAGTFDHTLSVDGHSITSAGGTDGFVMHMLTATLASSWLDRVGGPYDDSLSAIGVVSSSVIAIGTAMGPPSVDGTDAGYVGLGGADVLVVPIFIDSGVVMFGGGPSGSPGDDRGLAIGAAAGRVWFAGAYGATVNLGFASFANAGGNDAVWSPASIPF